MSEIIFPEGETIYKDTELRSSFSDLISSINPDADMAVINQVFDEFVSHYSEPHRKHHTLNHIQELLSLAEQLRETITDYETVILAIWGHDLNYQVQDYEAKVPHGENERTSAEDSGEFYEKLGISPQRIEKVKKYIEATAKHQSDDDDADLLLFLDMDMAILGASWPRYMQYAKAIRQEYGWVKPEDYRDEKIGRIGFLRGTTEKPVFKTAEFTHLEDQAKTNMAKEIEWLLANPSL